ASEVKIPFTTPVGIDWEDGVWLLRFIADKTEAGGGQFWVAVDPDHYQFVLPGRALAAAAQKPAAPAPAKSSQPVRPRPTAVPKKKMYSWRLRSLFAPAPRDALTKTGTRSSVRRRPAGAGTGSCECPLSSTPT